MIKRTLSTWSLSIIAAAVVMSSFVLVWSYIYHVAVPAVIYGPLLGEFEPHIARAGDTVKLCRDITFTRPVTLDITRSLTSRSVAGDITIEFGSMTVHRDSGPLSQCRLVMMPPDLTRGEWVMRSWVTYTTWPFWRATEEAPPVFIHIIDDDGMNQ